MPRFIPASAASGVATPSITAYAASLIMGISTRLETNPGASFTPTGFFPSFSDNSIVVANVPLLAAPLHQSHRRHGVEKMHADKLFSTPRFRGELRDRNRRRVARQDHAGPQ